MKLIYLPLLMMLYMVPVVSFAADPIDKVAEFIRQGNISELSKLFAPSVEITMPGQENVYSKEQAGIILDRFFSQNKPRSIKMLHKINSNPNYLFGVVMLTTDKGTFRISYTLKGTAGSMMLIEMSIEQEKAK
jgi:hypothetical protein